MEHLFNQMVSKDLQKMNELVRKGWYETSDFSEAVLNLSNSLAMYHQAQGEKNENCKKGECLQKGELAKGA